MKTNLSFKASALALAFGFGLASCNDDDDNGPIVETEENIVEVASSNAQFSTLVAAVDEAGLVATLSGEGPFTVFAPNNDAFASFLADNDMSAEELLSNPELGTILTYHVTSGRVMASDVSTGSVTSAAELPFFISEDIEGNLWINGEARITATDIAASNGVIHQLDYVITPPTQSIAEIAVSMAEADTPEFTHLVAALVRADLVGALDGDFEDNYTVFAPTDEAFETLFEALGVSSVDEIEVGLLTDVLLYHVVDARAFSQDLRQDATLPTLLTGEELTVDLANLQINTAGLVTSLLNVHATNGVIHVIDAVLLPPMED
ncbi:fasciclin domain-containing protein [Belliella sp. DSM 111904]|uniref:Fasciclin domain-containing protein n=1 Tax=Belliella filtrata TaxID=2923435 RepID=A0ABS9UVK0_9BACT|nr:fasciclin domain-containing protein [Belliella filtrata]MCH7407985.1 fasciclin domain-containing protein [Belliella filtrata]